MIVGAMNVGAMIVGATIIGAMIVGAMRLSPYIQNVDISAVGGIKPRYQW